MASNTILEQLKEEASESKMVGLMREILAATSVAAKTALTEKLAKLGEEPSASCKIKREIDAFKFEEPRLTLEECLNAYRANTQYEPIQEIHWKNEYGVHYMNVEENSYPMNEEFEGRKRLFAWYDKKARMTEEERVEVDKAGMDDEEVFDAKNKAYEWNLDARRVAPIWRKCKRIQLGDIRAEDTAIRFVRRPNKGDEGQVDWYKTIKELVKVGTSLGYTINHYKVTMDRWVSFFAPNLRTMTEPMYADMQARLLMNMTAPENEYDRLTHELYSLVRKAGTSLNVVLAQLHEIATARAAEINITNVEEDVARIMNKGFERFTDGKTKEEFLKAYEYNKREGKGQITWSRMMEKMIERERKYGMPSVDLRFSDNVKPGKSTSAFVAKNYNVNTKAVGDSVKPYRPTTTLINRHEHYEDSREEKDEFTVGKYDVESVPKLEKKKGLNGGTPSREGSQVGYESAAEETGTEGEDTSKEEPEESGTETGSEASGSVRRSERSKKEVDYTGKTAKVNNTKIDKSKQDNKNKFAKKSTPVNKENKPDNRSRTPERKVDRKNNSKPFDRRSSNNQNRQFRDNRSSSRDSQSRDRNSSYIRINRNNRNNSSDRQRQSRNIRRNFRSDRRQDNRQDNSRGSSIDRASSYERRDSRNSDRRGRREFRDRRTPTRNSDRRDRSTSANYNSYRDNRRQQGSQRGRDNSRRRPERRYASDSRSTSRGRSSSGPYEWKPESCDPGVNCAPGYSKDAAKTCSKCNIHTHRE